MKPNVIFITIDALRADYTYNHPSVHPFLNRLMDRSMVFKRAISPSGATNRTFKALFTDQYPFDNISSDPPYFHISQNAEHLTNKFRNVGYYTMGFSSNANLTRVQGYDRMFDYFYDGLGEEKETSTDFQQTEIQSILKSTFKRILESFDWESKIKKKLVGKYMSYTLDSGFECSESLVKKAKNQMEMRKKDQPLFLWLHMMEVHSPYNIPRTLFREIDEKPIRNWERQWLRYEKHNNARVSESELTDEDMDKIKTMYKCGIRYVDSLIENFFKYLKRNGFLDDCLFVITSDHGENLGDWDLLSHRKLYNSNIHVPLIIHNGSDQKEYNQTFDNYRLLNLLYKLSQGDNLQNSIQEFFRPAISESGMKETMNFAIQDEKYKIVINKGDSEKEYYRLENMVEKDLIENEDLKNINELENTLINHIRRQQNQERRKIDEVIKKINI
ncbi:MAG: sulfatase-like hydrolase/transferase [Thermoplasmatota archaeon]